MVVILVVLASLVLSALTQPWDSMSTESTEEVALPQEPSLEPSQAGTQKFPIYFAGQVFVSLIFLLAALAELTGWNLRDLFGSGSTRTSVEAFPFHIIRDFDDLLDYLFPDPKSPLLPDRSVPFLPRIASELEAAFRERGRVLIRGRSKTGKSREAVELLRRWWHTGPTVLLAKNHIRLCPPYNIPDNLPVRNLVLFIERCRKTT